MAGQRECPALGSAARPRGRSACLDGILLWLLGAERLAQRSLSA
jgi:hypothetical protein